MYSLQRGRLLYRAHSFRSVQNRESSNGATARATAPGAALFSRHYLTAAEITPSLCGAAPWRRIRRP